MSKLERITVTLPEEMLGTMRAAVESGRYATTSEIVREALRDWNAEQLRNIRSLGELRALLEAADASPAVDGDTFMRSLRERMVAGAAERGEI